MQINTETRTSDARALAVAIGLGCVVGLTVGGAYLAGSLARFAVATPGKTNVASASPGLIAAASASAGAPSARIQPVAVIHISASPAAGAYPVVGDEDRRCLAQAVYYEARGESPTGQAAVAQVVLNRARLPSFPKTLCGVVYQRSGDACQFSFACNGAMHGTVDETAWRRAQQVAGRVLGGMAVADVRGATMFQAVSAVGRGGFASSLSQVAQIGAHVFYRLTGRGAGSRIVEPSIQHDLVHATFVSLQPQSVHPQPIHVVFEGPAPAAQLAGGSVVVAPVFDPTPATVAPSPPVALSDPASTQAS